VKKFINTFLVLVLALFAFGCETAVLNLDEEDAQTSSADVTNGADVSTSADISTPQGADTSTKADIAKKDTTAPKADTVQKPDTNTNDAGADTTSDTDTSSPQQDAAQNDVDATSDGSTDTSSSDANDAGVDSADSADSADGSADSSTDTSDSADSVDAGTDSTVTCVPSPEVCDGKDNDCDGLTDEDVNPEWMQTYYEDKDADGFGNPNKPIKACMKPASYVVIVNNPDCGDNDPLIRPGALERCNNLDDDCDGQTDENVKPVTYYVDEDNDGYGSDKSTVYLPVILCDNGYQAIPSYYVPNKDDCNDKAASAHPGATEVCSDNKDNDCDGQTDEGCNVCDEVACGALGGKCEAGACKSFCDTCGIKTACEDKDQDGLGDVCTPIPPNMIAPPYATQGVDNRIVVILPNVPVTTDFSYGYQTYKKTSEIGAEWPSYDPWHRGTNFYVMDFLVNGNVNTPPNVGFNDPDACGIRFSADIKIGSSYDHWLCEGNGATAHWYDPGTRFFRVKNSVMIEVTKHVLKFSPPGGPSSGCSAQLPIKSCSN